MGKHKKKKKIADHRNEGFHAREAMFEHNEEKTQLINKQIITKEGLKMYTEEEAMEKAGPVTEYDYNLRYTWEEFKAMPDINKIEYIKYLQRKYYGIGGVDFALMFGVSSQALFSVCKNLKVNWPKRLPRNSEGKKLFRAEMVEIPEYMDRLPDRNEQTFDLEPVPAEYDVQRVSVSCDVSRVSEVLLSIGFLGRVQVTAEVIDEKEVV